MTPPITLKIESHPDEVPVETVETVDARAPINARQVGTPFPHLQRLHLQSLSASYPPFLSLIAPLSSTCTVFAS